MPHAPERVGVRIARTKPGPVWRRVWTAAARAVQQRGRPVGENLVQERLGGGTGSDHDGARGNLAAVGEAQSGSCAVGRRRQ